MESKKAEEKDIGTLPLEEPPEGVFETYANLVDADWTLTDVSLRFMQLKHVAPENNPTNVNREAVVIDRAYITLPWFQVKVLAGSLANLVQSYELENGVLKKPELAQRPTEPPIKALADELREPSSPR